MKATRIIASILGICFLAFAAVQYNDPDAGLWILIYFIAASLCFMVVKGKASTILLLAAALLYGIGAVYLWPDLYEGISIGGGDINNIEEARESLGLGMCSASFVLLALLQRYTRKGTAPAPKPTVKQKGLV